MRAPRWLRRDPPVVVATPGVAVPDFGGPMKFVFTVPAPVPPRTVSGSWLQRLVDLTKDPAMRELDAFYGTDSWCTEIRTHASMEGPMLAFTMTIDPRVGGESQAAMTERVVAEFERRWSAALSGR